MKLTLLILLATFVHLSASVYSQQTKLNISLKDVSVREVLKNIEDESDFFFLYTNEDVDVNRKVSVDAKNQSVEDILARVFNGTNVSYHISDRQIVLTNNNSAISFLQQQRTVTGKVTDSSGQPLPGVTVVVKGTTNGTITNMDGIYSLSNIHDGAIFVFSFVGMESKEIAIKGKPEINVTMVEATIGLEEVVAIGYGTQKRSHFAGASAGINAEKEKIDEVPVESIDKALQGRLAGVQIRDVEGQVGLSPQITIRGISSFSASTDPLIVIDGLPLVGGSLNDINMGDVASVEILKDAASSAIYGSRGANGVILVTTKSGGVGKAAFNVKVRTGVSNVLKYFDTYKDYEEFARNQWYKTIVAPWETSFLKNGEEVPGDPENYTTYLPFESYFSNQINPGNGTVYNATGAGYYNLHRLNQITKAPNPQESVTNNNAKNTNVFLSAQGGNEKISYYLSIDYKDVEGVMINNNLKSLSFNSSIKAKLNNKVQVEFNLKPNYQNSNISSNAHLEGRLDGLLIL